MRDRAAPAAGAAMVFAVLCMRLGKAGAEFVLASGPGKEAIGERAQVEACSAGDDGQLAASGNLAQSSAGQTAVFARGEGLVGIGDVDQVMRQARPFFPVGLAVPRSMPR